EPPHLRLRVVARLERLEHPRAHRRELRRRPAHDHRDDRAAICGLRLDEAAGTVDAEADAVPGHAELELACGARAIVTPVRARRDEEHVRPLALEHLAKGGAPPAGVVVAELRARDLDDDLRAAPRRLPSRLGEVVPEDERDVLAAELPRELPPLRQE